MNISYIIGVISSLLFVSAPPKGDMIVAEFTIYMNGERTELTWEAKYDRNVYADDCQALWDLYSFKHEICDVYELKRLEMILREYMIQKDTLENPYKKI